MRSLFGRKSESSSSSSEFSHSSSSESRSRSKSRASSSESGSGSSTSSSGDLLGVDHVVVCADKPDSAPCIIRCVSLKWPLLAFLDSTSLLGCIESSLAFLQTYFVLNISFCTHRNATSIRADAACLVGEIYVSTESQCRILIFERILFDTHVNTA